MTHRGEPTQAIDFNDENSNTSANPHFEEVLGNRLSRRSLFRGAGLAATALGATAVTGCATTGRGSSVASVDRLGFKPVAKSLADTVVVPEGYTAQVIAPWGEPVGIPGAMPAWKADASNTAADQAVLLKNFLPLFLGLLFGLLGLQYGAC